MQQPITRRQHGLADFTYVPVVGLAPELVGFEENKTAADLCRVFSASALAYALLTRAEWGAAPVIPFRTHLAFDVGCGVLALALPWLCGFNRDEKARNTFLAMGVVGLAAGFLTQPEEMPEELPAATVW